jgi:hypothetical protein
MTQRTISILVHTTAINMNVWTRVTLAEQAMS